jgi:hypothetical protein
MRSRWTIAGIVGPAVSMAWLVISNGILVGRVPSKGEQQRSIAERRAEALRTGGLKEAAKVTGEFISETSGPDWGGAETIAELVQASTLILIGRTESNRSRLDSSGNLILSAYQFEVESVLKGEHALQRVTVVLLGGRVVFDDGSIAELRVARTERPVSHEKYLLFLSPPKGQPAAVSELYEPGELTPVFGSQGLYRLPGGGAEVVPADRRTHGLLGAIRRMQPAALIKAVQQAIRAKG